MITTMDDPKFIFRCEKGHIIKTLYKPKECPVCKSDKISTLSKVVTKGN